MCFVLSANNHFVRKATSSASLDCCKLHPADPWMFVLTLIRALQWGSYKDDYMCCPSLGWSTKRFPSSFPTPREVLPCLNVVVSTIRKTKRRPEVWSKFMEVKTSRGSAVGV